MERPSIPELPLFRSLVKGKKVLFLSHVRPDMDTLCSSLAFTHFFSRECTPTFGVVEPLSDFQIDQIHFFSIRPKLISSVNDFDVVICVDFRSPNQGGPLSHALQSYKGHLVILDHHHPSPDEFKRISLALIKPHSISTTQLAAQIGLEMKGDFTKPIATALAMGIVTDSARFMVANPQTFALFDFLVQKSGKPYEEILSRAVPVSPIHERVGIFHSLKNAKLVSAGDFLFASISSPHPTGQIASALIQMGADVGLCFSHSPEGVFASIRVSGRAHSELGYDAMRLITPFAQQHGGSGGGHARAAQLNLPPYFSEQMLVDYFSRELFMQVKRNHPRAILKIH
jgi:nanoRNase/pAp phosphatase (c-di-AMP/oligoRNAs hydrolase)